MKSGMIAAESVFEALTDDNRSSETEGKIRFEVLSQTFLGTILVNEKRHTRKNLSFVIG